MNTSLAALLFDSEFCDMILAQLANMVPVATLAERTASSTGLGLTACTNLIEMIILDSEDGEEDDEA